MNKVSPIYTFLLGLIVAIPFYYGLYKILTLIAKIVLIK